MGGCAGHGKIKILGFIWLQLQGWPEADDSSLSFLSSMWLETFLLKCLEVMTRSSGGLSLPPQVALLVSLVCLWCLHRPGPP